MWGGCEHLQILVDVNQAYTVHRAEQVGRALEEFEVVEGAIAVPQGPGLGVEVDEEEIQNVGERV